MGLFERRPDREVAWGTAGDEALPIGSTDFGPVSARRSEMVRVAGGAEDLLFAEEEPIELYMSFRQLGEGASDGMWRIEIKVPQTADKLLRRPRAGDELVVAEYPHANGWVTVARFKPPDKRSTDQRRELGTVGSGGEKSPASVPPDRARILADIAERTTDAWERGSYLTAAPDPTPLEDIERALEKIRQVAALDASTRQSDDEPSAVLEERSSGSPLHERAPRSSKRAARWVFGVCADFAGSRAFLTESARARNLVDDARRGLLRTFHPVGGARTRQSRAIHPLAGAAAEHVLFVAASQALAGPWKHEAQWSGKPVLDLVESIFRSHLDNMSRVFSRWDRRHLRGSDDP